MGERARLRVLGHFPDGHRSLPPGTRPLGPEQEPAGTDKSV